MKVYNNKLNMKGLEAFWVDGKVALITGGGAGIGNSCA